MLNISLIYGLLTGTIIITTMLVGFALGSLQDLGAAQWLGYLIMILAFSLIFFGTKRYRDRDFGGIIKFWPAFIMGMAIAFVASIVYVIVWEIYLQITDFAFMAEYTKSAIEQKTAEGLTGEALATQITDLQNFEALYANPFFRLPVTFAEIFPVGLIVALISSALLRNPKFASARS